MAIASVETDRKIELPNAQEAEARYLDEVLTIVASHSRTVRAAEAQCYRLGGLESGPAVPKSRDWREPDLEDALSDYRDACLLLGLRTGYAVARRAKQLVEVYAGYNDQGRFFEFIATHERSSVWVRPVFEESGIAEDFLESGRMRDAIPSDND